MVLDVETVDGYRIHPVRPPPARRMVGTVIDLGRAPGAVKVSSGPVPCRVGAGVIRARADSVAER